MKVFFSAKTNTGRVRRENQDSYGISEGKNIYFILDGMGGGAAGDFASRYSSEMMLRCFDMLTKEEIVLIAGKPKGISQFELLTMLAAIRLANRALSNLSSEYPALSGMGTTVTGVYFDPRLNILHILHVGDSRVYRLRNGVLDLLTKDHSKVNELLDQGKMKEEEVKTAEIQSMITRALGTAPKVKVDYKPEYAKDGDYIMLCTDGLNGEVDDTQIRNIMVSNKSTPDQMAAKLIEAANTAGGRDNTTVIVLNIYDDKKTELPPYDSRPGKVITIDEETPEETKAEDKILKKLMNNMKNQVPKSAKEKSFLGHPLVLGSIFAVLLAVFGIFMPRCSTERSTDKQLMDLAGKVSGLKIDIREPVPEQLQVFKKSEDTVSKLQIIQDWYRDSQKFTMPLKDVALSISDGKREQFRGATADIPMEIKLDRGSFIIRLRRPGYKLVTEKMEIKDSSDVTIELASSYIPVLLIMIPQ